MRPIDGDVGGVGLQGRGAEAGAGGLCAPGLDVATLWREVFAVAAGGEANAPQRAAGATSAPSGASHRAGIANEESGRPTSHEAGPGVSWRWTGTVAASPERNRAVGVSAGEGRSSNATPLARRDAAAAGGPDAAVADVPSPPVGSLRSAAPSDAPGANPARDPVTAGGEAAPRARTDEPASHGCAAGRSARTLDGGAASKISARESVQVRCHDGAVFVIVRDASLAPAEAIRCSLETAYALRGERAALRRVSLNGRTVFERPAAAPSAGGGPPDRLCFAC